MRRFACRLPSLVRWVCRLLVLVGAHSLQPSAGAQHERMPLAQGTHLFRRILHDLGLHPLKDRRDVIRDPGRTLLIVLGETNGPGRPFDLADFVNRGGALLAATDRHSRQELRAFGVEVVGYPVKVPGDTKFAYKESEECIFVQTPDQDSPLFKSLAVEDNLSRVATNRPGYLARDAGCALGLLATFPPGCWVDYDRLTPRGRPADVRARLLRARRLDQDTLLPFAVGGPWGSGRVLILSDHSVFINAMLWQQDIDNFDFAYNCVNWLTEEGQRTQVLFLEEGEVQETFEIPLQEPPTPPLPPLRALIETVDKGLGELERDNVFNEAIHNGVTNATWPPEKWVQAVVLMLTLALAVFGLARLTQARHRSENAAPPPASGLARALPAASLFEQRHQSMLREGNLWEAARALARRGLESALGPPSVAASQPPGGAAATPPLLGMRGDWWRRWRLRRRFRRLWRLAYGTEPVRVSSRQLRRLGAEIESLRAALTRAGPPHGELVRGGEGKER